MSTFADPLVEALAILRASSALHDVEFGTLSPTALGEAFPGLPYVALEITGTDTDYPFREVVTIEATAHAETPYDAGRLAQRVRAALAAADTSAAAFSAGTRGPRPVADSEPPASVVELRARLRPE